MIHITGTNNRPFETFSKEYNHPSSQKQIQFYTYGDSHSFCATMSLFKSEVGSVKWTSNWLGPKLMYSVGRDGLSLLNITKNGIPPKNSIHMFSFGAIDIGYVFKGRKRKIRGKKRNDKLDGIEKMVSNYEKVLLMNYSPDYHFWILGIPPPSNGYKSAIHLTEQMNFLLMEMSKRNGFFFLDTFNAYQDRKGFLRKDISDTANHIGEYLSVTVKEVANEFDKVRSF